MPVAKYCEEYKNTYKVPLLKEYESTLGKSYMYLATAFHQEKVMKIFFPSATYLHLLLNSLTQALNTTVKIN